MMNASVTAHERTKARVFFLGDDATVLEDMLPSLESMNVYVSLTWARDFLIATRLVSMGHRFDLIVLEETLSHTLAATNFFARLRNAGNHIPIIISSVQKSRQARDHLNHSLLQNSSSSGKIGGCDVMGNLRAPANPLEVKEYLVRICNDPAGFLEMKKPNCQEQPYMKNNTNLKTLRLTMEPVDNESSNSTKECARELNRKKRARSSSAESEHRLFDSFEPTIQTDIFAEDFLQLDCDEWSDFFHDEANDNDGKSDTFSFLDECFGGNNDIVVYV